MGAIKVYIKPFNSDGTYQDDFIDVSVDVSEDSIGTIKQALDGSDYDVGVITNSSFTMKLNNQSGIYNDVGSLTSIFRYRRAGSIVKVTWSFGESVAICGMAICGQAVLGSEETIFEGFLEDIATVLNVETNLMTFKVLGQESIFDSVEKPELYPANSDIVSQAIYDILNQDELTNIFTVSLANMTPSLDFTIDDVDSFENSTVKEVLDELLEASNSILSIVDNVIYVTSRDETAELQYTFYGQASPRGVENIAGISNYRNGVNRMFNLWTWTDTSLVARNSTSISDYGVSKKEISYDFVTTEATQQAILDNLLDEFGTPKIEMDLNSLWDYETIGLIQLDKVSVDYPTNSIATGNNTLPLYGFAKYGEDKYPYSEFSLIIGEDERFKIIGKEVNLKAQKVLFKLREV